MIATMERRTIARALRAVRRRKRWSQRRLGSMLGISKSEMSRWERGALEKCSVPELQRWATALGAHVVIDLRVEGERPTADAQHARIQTWLVMLLRDAGWVVEPEASFNHYGDRGRIDVLAYHPGRRIMLVVEIKSRVDDVQDLIGRQNVKVRVAAQLAVHRGWNLTATVSALVIREGATARRRIKAHAALFAPYELRARAAIAWLRGPTSPAPTGILALVTLPD